MQVNLPGREGGKENCRCYLSVCEKVITEELTLFQFRPLELAKSATFQGRSLTWRVGGRALPTSGWGCDSSLHFHWLGHGDEPNDSLNGGETRGSLPILDLSKR